uniref:Uncharacterized protein n=1 Tax=Rhizophora mucronata TaxID=61149 RepID=A0A2P2N754_RHIMU
MGRIRINNQMFYNQCYCQHIGKAVPMRNSVL